jgi:hypothetical protein
MVRWSPENDRVLRSTRGVSFQQIADAIISGEYLYTLENPSRHGPDIFVLRVRGYPWVAPFVLENDDTIFLKTAYPSRKFHNRYGGDYEREG